MCRVFRTHSRIPVIMLYPVSRIPYRVLRVVYYVFKNAQLAESTRESCILVLSDKISCLASWSCVIVPFRHSGILAFLHGIVVWHAFWNDRSNIPRIKQLASRRMVWMRDTRIALICCDSKLNQFVASQNLIIRAYIRACNHAREHAGNTRPHGYTHTPLITRAVPSGACCWLILRSRYAKFQFQNVDVQNSCYFFLVTLNLSASTVTLINASCNSYMNGSSLLPASVSKYGGGCKCGGVLGKRGLLRKSGIPKEDSAWLITLLTCEGEQERTRPTALRDPNSASLVT